MSALATGQARGLIAARGRTLPIRAARLGFFVSGALLVACTGNPDERARAADRTFRTAAFAWLRTHEPARLAVDGVAPGTVRDVVPRSVVIAADSAAPCRAAQAARAALLELGPPVARERALGCGAVLYRDAHAVVVAPL